MKTILETDRLLLREFDVSDAESFYELNLNPNVIKYTVFMIGTEDHARIH